MTSLSGLEHLVGLRELSVSDSLGPWRTALDLAPIGRLGGLERLCLRRSQVVDLGPLCGCARLEVLDVEATRVRDLAPLAAVGATLRRLNAKWTEVVNTTGLEACTVLKELDLGRTKLDSQGLAALGSSSSSCRALERLVLSDCATVHLEPLLAHGSCPSLRVLELSMANIDRGRADRAAAVAAGCACIDGLSQLRASQLPRLEVLDMTASEATSLGPLKCCPLLRELVCTNSRRLVDISALADCPRLELLQCDGCVDLRDLTGLGPNHTQVGPTARGGSTLPCQPQRGRHNPTTTAGNSRHHHATTTPQWPHSPGLPTTTSPPAQPPAQPPAAPPAELRGRCIINRGAHFASQTAYALTEERGRHRRRRARAGRVPEPRGP